MERNSLMSETIANAFKRLLMKNEFEKVSVKLIAAEAGITRSRFYNYFQDKYDVMEWIVRRALLDPVLPLVEKEMYPEALRKVFACVDENRNFFTRAFRIQGQNGFHEVMERVFTPVFVEVYKDVSFDYANPIITRYNIARYQSLALILYLGMWICDHYYGDATHAQAADAYLFMITQGNNMVTPTRLQQVVAEELLDNHT